MGSIKLYLQVNYVFSLYPFQHYQLEHYVSDYLILPHQPRLSRQKLDQPPKALVSRAMSPKCIATPGKMPRTNVVTAVMTNANLSEPGIRIGVVSPSGTGFIQISRMTLP